MVASPAKMNASGAKLMRCEYGFKRLGLPVDQKQLVIFGDTKLMPDFIYRTGVRTLGYSYSKEAQVRPKPLLSLDLLDIPMDGDLPTLSASSDTRSRVNILSLSQPSNAFSLH